MTKPRLTSAAAVLMPAAALGVLSLAGVSAQEAWRHHYDLDIYLAAGRSLGSGIDPYSIVTDRNLGFTYPPIALLPFAALGQLSNQVAYIIWLIAIALTFAGCALTLLRRFSAVRQVSTAHVIVASVLAVSTEPIADSMTLGQLSPMIGALGLLAFLGTARQGLLAGLGGALKLTPLGQLGGFLAMRRPLTPIAWAITGFAVVTGLAALALPDETRNYFGSYLWDTGRVGQVATASNTSLAGWLAHVHLDPSLASRVAIGLCAIAFAWWVREARQHRASVIDLAIGSACLTTLVVPVSWSHHAFAVAMAVLCLAWNGRWLCALGLAVVWAAPVFVWAQHVPDPLGMLLVSLRPITLIALLVASAHGTLGPRRVSP